MKKYNTKLQLVESNASNLEHALRYASIGWCVHPVHYMKGEKCSCGGRQGCKPAKHPRTKWKDWATTDQRKINAYWTKYPDANVAISTGTVSSLLVVDIDPDNGGDTSLQTAIDTYELTAELDTFTVRSGSGGAHYYYRCDKAVKNYAGSTMLGAGIDIRGEGGYVIAPPSNHASGDLYSIINDIEPIELPEKLLSLIESQMPEETVICKGKRNNWVAEQAGQFLRNHKSPGKLKKHLHELNALRCNPPLGFDEVETIAGNYITSFNASNENISLKTRWQNSLFDVDLGKRIKPSFIAVLQCLSMYMNTEGSCYPEQETLAKRLGMTRQTVRKYLMMAEQLGYLKTFKIGRKSAGGFHYGYKAVMPKITLSC